MIVIPKLEVKTLRQLCDYSNKEASQFVDKDNWVSLSSLKARDKALAEKLEEIRTRLLSTANNGELLQSFFQIEHSKKIEEVRKVLEETK